MRTSSVAALIVSVLMSGSALAGQPPYGTDAPDIPVSSQDRVYAGEQFSNTVSVTDPSTNTLLGVISLGQLSPSQLSPLYTGQSLVHGLGFSPDNKTLAVVSIGSNSVTFIDTQTNEVKHTTYVGRAPHEAFFTQDGSEVWVTVRGEDYVSVIDATTYEEKERITVPNGPGMTIFSPDGQYAYVCSSFTPETSVIDVSSREIVGTVPQVSPFCPNIAVTPDGSQVWFTLKDSGKTQVFDGRPPFAMLSTMDTGPISNHVNIANNANGTFAYVTIGGLNQVKVINTDNFEEVATIPTGDLPHGVWPSGDGTMVYVGLENADELIAIDTMTNEVVGTVPIGQAPQAVVYVPQAVTEGDGTANLLPLGITEETNHYLLAGVSAAADEPVPTNVTLFNQGPSQILEASVTGLQEGQSYVLGLADNADGTGNFEPLAQFMANPAGAAIVNAVGNIQEQLDGEGGQNPRFIVIVEGTTDQPGDPVQIQDVTPQDTTD